MYLYKIIIKQWSRKKKENIESSILNWNTFNGEKEILNINSWTIKMIAWRGWILGRRSSSFLA